jgi:NADH:ubiquinone oxidoreductase subunit C
MNFINTLIKLLPIIKISTDFKNNFFIYIDPKNILVCLNFLKNHQIFRFRILTTISCTDYPEKFNRFEISYILLAIDYPFVIHVKTNVSEFQSILSISSIFQSSVWLEREIWDMFGIYFKNNLDLRRILTDYGFPYHPLRKTFPLMGFTEVYYNFLNKKILYKPLRLSQLKNIKRLNLNWSFLKF